MVVDSSALVAILESESEADHFLSALHSVRRRFASAVTVYETGIVALMRRGGDSIVDVRLLVGALDLEVVPFTEPYITAAWEAYSRFGKGVDPRARLNLGDCAAYALAKTLDLPLLFKGSDFTHTDIRRAV